MSDIRAWLDGLGLGEYAEVFEVEKVTVDTLDGLDCRHRNVPNLSGRLMSHEVSFWLSPDQATRPPNW